MNEEYCRARLLKHNDIRSAESLCDQVVGVGGEGSDLNSSGTIINIIWIWDTKEHTQQTTRNPYSLIPKFLLVIRGGLVMMSLLTRFYSGRNPQVDYMVILKKRRINGLCAKVKQAEEI